MFICLNINISSSYDSGGGGGGGGGGDGGDGGDGVGTF